MLHHSVAPHDSPPPPSLSTSLPTSLPPQLPPRPLTKCPTFFVVYREALKTRPTLRCVQTVDMEDPEAFCDGGDVLFTGAVLGCLYASVVRASVV